MIATLRDLVAAPPPHLTPDHLRFYDDYERAMVDRLYEYVDRVGLLQEAPDGRRLVDHLHPGTLLEIASFLQIEEWHRTGLGALLSDALPPLDVARRDIYERCLHGDLGAGESPQLRMTWPMVSVLVERLAVAGPGILGAEIVLGVADEDALIDAVAQLIWDRRHVPINSTKPEANYAEAT